MSTLRLPPEEFALLRKVAATIRGSDEPRWPTPDELRDFLRENVTIVKPGETLVIQVGEGWTPSQVRELTDFLNWQDETGESWLPFRVLVVPGTGLGIAEASAP